MGRFLNVKTFLILFILIALSYLIKGFPEESVLILSIALIIVIGFWIIQAQK